MVGGGITDKRFKDHLEATILPEEEAVMPKARSFYYPAGSDGVLLVHGFAGSIDSLRPLGRFLYTKGYTVHGVRLAGHGLTIDALDKTTTADWLDSVRAGLDRLRQQCQSITVIGASLGGNLALLLSLERPDITKIVLLSTPLKVHGQWWKRWLIPALLPVKKYYHKEWIKNETDQREHEQSGSYLKVSLRAFRHALKVFAQTKKILPRVRVPVLLVYAKYDEVIKPSSAEYLYRHLGTSSKRLLWVESSGHQPHDSGKRQSVFEQILHFLAERYLDQPSQERASLV